MKILEKISIILLILVVLLSLSGIVNAAAGDSYSVKLSPSKKEISAGETVKVTITLDNVNIQSGEKGLGSYQGKISYDKDVFELVSVEGASGWDTPAENSGIITAARSDGKTVAGTQQVAVINLKAKSNAKAGASSVKVTNFEASNAVENIATSDASVSITIKSATEGQSGTSNDGSATSNSNSGTTAASTSASSSKTTKKTSEASGKLPKTGVSETIIVAIAVVTAKATVPSGR